MRCRLSLNVNVDFRFDTKRSVSVHNKIIVRRQCTAKLKHIQSQSSWIKVKLNLINCSNVNQGIGVYIFCVHGFVFLELTYTSTTDITFNQMWINIFGYFLEVRLKQWEVISALGMFPCDSGSRPQRRNILFTATWVPLLQTPSPPPNTHACRSSPPKIASTFQKLKSF